ncbi:unnamed protein product, partial [Amoebophrya sp. A25]|eukprot:GSA25T00003835001.1
MSSSSPPSPPPAPLSGIILIDPVEDFVNCDGAFVREFGPDACRPLHDLVHHEVPQLFAEASGGRKVGWILVVQSEYRVNQFVGSTTGTAKPDEQVKGEDASNACHSGPLIGEEDALKACCVPSPLANLCTTANGRRVARPVADALKKSFGVSSGDDIPSLCPESARAARV